MKRTIRITLATLVAALTPVAANADNTDVVVLPNASVNGTLITVPICKDLSTWPYNIPAGFDIKKADGTACTGYDCFYSYGLWSQGGSARTVSWDQDATLFGVTTESCPCGVFDSCAASQEPRTVTVMPSSSTTTLMQITGEIFNVTDAAVQAHVEYRAYKNSAGHPDAPLTLAIQVLQGYGWVDVATRSLPYEPSFWGNLYHSADLTASVPANSQIRAELRWAVTKPANAFSPPYTFNLKAASLFGAQCFPSPDPNTVMCQ